MTTAERSGHYLIKGITRDRKVFRPGDWAERLMDVIVLFVGERRPGFHIASTRLAMPFVDTGVKCLMISDELRRVCPEVFEFVIRFAEDNDLALNRVDPGAG
ncbi:DUF3579 domain-containing protein [Paraburkholderia panacisoli]|uniref:DUF3579 domain-containing protein n=1 Tax=Paraburkholderia panacisoli TaxID=2603818 RepID=A0A5B0G8F0_9BURK|nr:DUF3579 domain-containing protein [Paraburkholderia panacisoli]KAA0998219.1 DUF3579 domain-containing protein [Paraburkholderia panacisoli]